MLTFTKVDDIQSYLGFLSDEGRTIGFVPTLGALHEGHISLINRCNQENEITVCSIFVNPTQFNQKTDLEKYPRPLSKDMKMLISNDTSILFLPGQKDIYPHSTVYQNPYDFGKMFDILEGTHRSGHFDGVVQVVERLLDIITPTHLYMGQKDYQQFSIIQEMLRQQRSNTKLVACETVRSREGLALSSRNVRLSDEDKKVALALYKSLTYVQLHYSQLSIAELKKAALKILAHPRIKVEYFEIVDGKTLSNIETKAVSDKVVAVVAAWVGKVRLIDNIVIKG